MTNETAKNGNGVWGCTMHVPVKGTNYIHRCLRPAKHDPVGGIPTRCGIHSAEAVEKRDSKKKARVREKRQEMHRHALMRERRQQEEQDEAHKESVKRREAYTLLEAIAGGLENAQEEAKAWLERNR